MAAEGFCMERTPTGDGEEGYGNSMQRNPSRRSKARASSRLLVLCFVAYFKIADKISQKKQFVYEMFNKTVNLETFLPKTLYNFRMVCYNVRWKYAQS